MFNNFIFLATDMNWGTNFKRWITEQAGALSIGVLVLILIPLIFRRQWSGLIGTLLIGAVAVYFVNNPDTLIDIGKGIYGLLTSGTK